jgi:hypothetical protein
MDALDRQKEIDECLYGSVRLREFPGNVRYRDRYARRIAFGLDAWVVAVEPRLFDIEDATRACGARQQVLRALKNKVPPEMGEADDIFKARCGRPLGLIP